MITGTERSELYNGLKGWLVEHKKTYKDVADLLHISAISTIARMINGPGDFSAHHLRIFMRKWGVPSEIFLNEKL